MNTSLIPDSSIELNVSEFAYGLTISIGIFVFITATILASYFCTRVSDAPQQVMAAPADIESGLDEATLMGYPKLLYSESKIDRGKKGSASAAICCSICLADYKDSDELRLLPDCVHVFHTKCVDPWLRLHPSCPLCRTSPLPTPVPTPLAEAVPLARQQG